MSVASVLRSLISPYTDDGNKTAKLLEYTNWVRTAKKGDRFLYHIGLSPQESFISSSVANRVYTDYTRGLVFPFSVRKAPGIFEFIAIRSGAKD